MTLDPVAARWVLEAEGGYVNDPNDPGGETNFGISKRAYPHEDIRSMTAERALWLYHRDYWLPLRCFEIAHFSRPLALALFDAGVNHGTRAAARMLQRVVGAEVDGHIGPNTVARLRGLWLDRGMGFVAEFLLERAFVYAQLRTARYYLVGWMGRLRRLRKVLDESTAGSRRLRE